MNRAAVPRDPLADLTERRLGPDDLDRVIALHAHLHEVSPEPGLFVRETNGFFAEHLSGAGAILGLETPQGALVCYSVLGWPDAESALHFGHMVGMPRDLRARTCHLDGTAVHPTWQGFGLQRHMTRRRLELARTQGRDHAVSTAALHNARSLSNLVSGGLRVVALVEKYDALRLVLSYGPRAMPDLAEGRAEVALDGSAEGHRRALSLGLVGTAVRRRPDGPVLVYEGRAA